MQYFCEALHCGKKICHRCLEHLLTPLNTLHFAAQFCGLHVLPTAFRSQTQSSRQKRNLAQTAFFPGLDCWLMYIISAWPLSDMKPSWWELICYSPSNFTQMIWVNAIPEFRIQMRSDLLRKESVFGFFPMLIWSILLLCPSSLLGLLLILCLKDVFIFPLLGMDWDISSLTFFSPGKMPSYDTLQCHIVFLILQLAWKTGCWKQRTSSLWILVISVRRC